MTDQSSGPPSRGRRRAPRRAPDVVADQAPQENSSQDDDFGAGVDDPVKPWDNHSDDFEPDIAEADVDSAGPAPQGGDRPHYSGGGGGGGGGDYDANGMPRRRRRRRRRRRPNEGGYNDQGPSQQHRSGGGGGQRGGHFPHHQNRGGNRPRGP